MAETIHTIIGTIGEDAIDVSIQKFTSMIGTEKREFDWPIQSISFNQLLRPFKNARVEITVRMLPR